MRTTESISTRLAPFRPRTSSSIEDRANPQRFHTLETTEDERFAILEISERGKGKDGNALFVRDLSRSERTFRPVVATIDDDSFSVIDNVGDKLFVATNRRAPNWRVVLVDPSHSEESSWKDVLPEKPEPLDGAGDGRRQTVCDVPEGCHDPRVRLQLGRNARERSVVAWPRRCGRLWRHPEMRRSSSTRSTR